MPLITNANRNVIILTDIVNWLSQIKLSGATNQPLALTEIAALGSLGIVNMTLVELAEMGLEYLADLDYSDLTCTISFYTDAARTNLVFTDDTAFNPSAFSIRGTKMFYTPPDALLNSAAALSTTLNQGVYYVTATYDDGTVVNQTYRNCDNLMFSSVVVANTPNPQFAKNENQALVVPSGERTERMKLAGDLNYLLCTFDVYVQLDIYNWANLSEVARVMAQQNAVNAIRNTLYIDRSRNGQCTFYSKDLRQTSVGDMKPIKSPDMCRCMVQVRTASLVESNGY